jgi:carboxymethylenebutenolidase
MLWLVLACSRPEAPVTPPPPAPAAGDKAAAPDPNALSWTGALSEEEFKKLHQLPAAEAPPLEGSRITLPGGSAAYLSLPEGTGPFPGVVVIHEWWGLNDHIGHWADRLADDGYAALAVDLYGGKVAQDRDSAMEMMHSVDTAKSIAILRDAHAFLQQDPRIAAPRTASVGWCMGGGWSLQLAMAEPALDATVMYYGHTEEDPAKLKAIAGPLLGIFAEQDTSIPPDAVARFDSALTAAGVKHQFFSYDAPHAFANPSTPRYDEASSKDAWSHVRTFLKDNLKAG